MIEVFYKEKAIIFDDNNNGYNINEILHYNGEDHILNISSLASKLEYSSRLVIICPSVESVYEIFISQFQQISAAGGVVSNGNNQTLMIFRNGRWDLPKGKLEDNEKIENCAVREVEEECGIDDIKLNDLICKTLHIYPLQGTWCLKTTWWFKMTSQFDKTLIPQTEEGITSVRWIDNDELEPFVNTSFLTIKYVVDRAQNKNNN